MPCPSRCMLGGEELAVAPSGRLYPCAQMVGEDDRDELCIGDVERGVDTAKVAAMQTKKERVEETCGTCALRDCCQSQCGCRHVALTGALGEITAVLCEVEGAMIAEAIAWPRRCSTSSVRPSCSSTTIEHGTRRPDSSRSYGERATF